MAQFHVYLNENETNQDRYPYLLDIQHDFLNHLETRLIIPLGKMGGERVEQLHLPVEIRGEHLIMVTTEMASAPLWILGEEVADLSGYASDIINAIDFLITGF
jgi:toxin CcdB